MKTMADNETKAAAPRKVRGTATAPPLPYSPTPAPPLKGRGMAAKGTKGQKVDIS